MHTVFVYGTLKRGYGNHGLIEQGGGEFLGEATTVEPMFLAGMNVPFASLAAQSSRPKRPIRGEVYRVDESTLWRLDRLEGHPHSYRRTPIKALIIGEASPIDVEIYLHPCAASLGEPCPIVNGAYEWTRDGDGNW